jgi:hypothetical protein
MSQHATSNQMQGYVQIRTQHQNNQGVDGFRQGLNARTIRPLCGIVGTEDEIHFDLPRVMTTVLCYVDPDLISTVAEHWNALLFVYFGRVSAALFST